VSSKTQGIMKSSSDSITYFAGPCTIECTCRERRSMDARSSMPLADASHSLAHDPVQSMCRAGPFAGDARGRYRLPPDGFAGVPPLPWFAKGEVGIASFGLSFFGFFASRLPRCSPLAMASLRLSVSSWLGSSHSWVELSSRWSKSALTRSISLRRRRSLASKLCAKRPSR